MLETQNKATASYKRMLFIMFNSTLDKSNDVNLNSRVMAKG